MPALIEAADAGQHPPGTPAAALSLQGAPDTLNTADRGDSALRELQLRTALGIRRIEWRYEYRGYRYDRLADAVTYARLEHDRNGQRLEASPDAQRLADETPSMPGEEEQAVMAQWGIGFEAGHYQLQGYRYERLSDALAYAQLLARRRPAA